MFFKKVNQITNDDGKNKMARTDRGITYYHGMYNRPYVAWLQLNLPFTQKKNSICIHLSIFFLKKTCIQL